MKSVIPDVANHQRAVFAKSLERVGMSDIEVPIKLTDGGVNYLSSGKAKAFVSLDDPETKGIHMSRLYVSTQSRFEESELSPTLFDRILEDFLISHKDLSTNAYLEIEFDLLTKRKALLSDNEGWRTYPVKIIGKKKAEGTTEFQIKIQIAYSSTCPCSAALARQLIGEQFELDFSERDSFSKNEMLDWLSKESSIMATPHGQRSHANVTLIPNYSKTLSSHSFGLVSYINQLEEAIKTPVQTAVKRIDEQEFARRNGQNLMFAEDAARNLAHTLDSDENISDFALEVIHYESLHNHDAYAMATKGIAGGLTS